MGSNIENNLVVIDNNKNSIHADSSKPTFISINKISKLGNNFCTHDISTLNDSNGLNQFGCWQFIRFNPKEMK
ncbi:MAG: hypothetical protein ACOVK9_06265 [Bacteroidia bacterium]